MSKKKEQPSQASVQASIVISVVLAVSTLAFLWQIISLKMLPLTYAAAVGVILVVLVGLLVMLTMKLSGSVAPKVVSVFVAVLLILGIVVAHSAKSLLKQVSNVNVSVNAVAVYVPVDDPAETLEDAKDYTFGILAGLDRPNTDHALGVMEEELGVAVATKEYTNMFELADAVRGKEVDALLVNGAYLSILKDDDSYYGFPQEIRAIWTCEIQRELEAAPEIDEERNSFVVYISGNDSTGSLSSAGRSDVNILMAVNPDTGEIVLANTPRDYYVDLPIVSGAKDKLTHAGIYGVDVSMNTLATLYDVPVDYFVRMNFSGFVQIIDALGGVTVENDTAFTGRGEHFDVGEIDLTGERALVFVRERYAFSAGDRKRGENQAAVIRGVIKKVASPAILTGYTQILSAVAGAFETNMTQERIAELVQMQLSQGIDWKISTISADGANDVGPNYSMPNAHVYRMIPDEQSVAAVSQRLHEVLGLN